MREQYANIIVDISIDKLDRTFSYRIPPELIGQIREGSRVRIPFGRGNTVRDGYVYSITDSAGVEPGKIKDILEYIPEAVTVEGRLFALAAWMRNTYGSTMNQALSTVLPVKYLRKRKSTVRKPAFAFDPDIERTPLPLLTKEQSAVFVGILREREGQGRPSLIYGITGSGKTSIYIRLIEKAIAEGRQSILLIPEISLTWQTVDRFYRCFGDRVAVLNSRLSKGEKSDLFEKVKAKEIDLVIGPRSALFTPFSDLGLIIIDEEHETSYQSEVTPRYNAKDAAVERARIEGAYVVMGSGTPSVESMYRCRTGEYAFFSLKERYGEASLPEVFVSDMRKELKEGNRTIISRQLGELMEETLAKGEQIMLFLNRRGHTGFFSCRSCGHVVKCPHCDISLTLHNDGKLMCHYCGYKKPMIKLCPECGSPYIGGFSIGTQQVEELVKELFPKAKVLRMDADTTKTKDSYEKILKSFAAGKADILIGTQMIVKGHDFPNVTLVGILAADTSLFAADYRSAERTYQLISQAVGRSGRGEKNGQAVIQTYNPEHFAISCAVDQDYEAFYDEEISDRQLLDYPPAGHIIAVHGSAEDEQLLEKAMGHLKEYASSIASPDIRILGPSPEVIAKAADSYRMIMYLRGTDKAGLIKIRRGMEKYIEINKGFAAVSVQFNLDS